MNCKNCKNWVFGRCVVSNLTVGPDVLCNAWEREGKSYFWMAGAIGLNDRNAPAVSKWFMAQGIRRKPAKESEG